MKAVVTTTYGSPEVLQLTAVEKPIPGANEVLIKIHAATVTSGDIPRRKGEPFMMRLSSGLMKPKQGWNILGSDLAGEVEAVGKAVTHFTAGDQVYGATGWSLGANAEYKCLPEDGLVALKPANMTYVEAAAIPFGAITALFFLRKGNVQSGQKVLIYGASGSIGTYAVQLAKAFGAAVTGVCSTTNLALVKSLGADQVIDYTQEDITQSGQTYDVIFDAVGKSSFSVCKDALTPQGIYLSTYATPSLMLQTLWTSIAGGKKALFAVSKPRKEDLIFLTGLIEAGKLKSVIDRRYPLEQTAEAHRYVDTQRKKGAVVITIN